LAATSLLPQRASGALSRSRMAAMATAEAGIIMRTEATTIVSNMEVGAEAAEEITMPLLTTGAGLGAALLPKSLPTPG